MMKIRKYIKVLIYPILFFLGQFAVEYVFVLMFNQHQIRILKNANPFLSYNKLVLKLNKYMTTIEYKKLLNNYINNKAFIIVLIISIIFIPLFLNVYKKYKKKRIKSLTKNDVVFISLLGMSVSLIFNIIFNLLNNIVYFTDQFQISSIPIIIQIVTSGIIGPTLEELLFRGIVYNKLKEFNKPMKSILFTSVFFALFHISNPINVIYAFAISFLLIYLYEKYKTIYASIIMHSIANITTIIMIPLIVKQMVWLNMFLLFLSLGVLIIIYYTMIRNDVKKTKKKLK